VITYCYAHGPVEGGCWRCPWDERHYPQWPAGMETPQAEAQRKGREFREEQRQLARRRFWRTFGTGAAVGILLGSRLP